MDKQIFDDLELPFPKYHIDGVDKKKYHGAQTAAMLTGIEDVLIKERPLLVLVGGDANTNLAGALAARKLQINLGHVEAGERSYDWRMPEEHNRRMIDHISEFLFTTNKKGARHLEEEKVIGKIFITGNTIVDAAYQNFGLAMDKSQILEENSLKTEEYAIITTHREENVDDPNKLAGIINGIELFARETGLKVFFAAHPRTLIRLKQFDLEQQIRCKNAILLHKAPSYIDFLALLGNAKLVLTDSGGVQQEACILKKPCVTLRESSEWTETIDIGANMLAGTYPKRILETALRMINSSTKWEAPFGDGKAAERILDIVCDIFDDRRKI
jgi:UDP-N-acetylglucosamine 2-epimerase (non-hydrolysing)